MIQTWTIIQVRGNIPHMTKKLPARKSKVQPKVKVRPKAKTKVQPKAKVHPKPQNQPQVRGPKFGNDRSKVSPNPTKPVFIPPPPHPRDGSPPYQLQIPGKSPVPFRDLIKCLQSMRYLGSLDKRNAVVRRVVDGVILAFLSPAAGSVKGTVSAHAKTQHMHRAPKNQRVTKKAS